MYQLCLFFIYLYFLLDVLYVSGVYNLNDYRCTQVLKISLSCTLVEFKGKGCAVHFCIALKSPYHDSVTDYCNSNARSYLHSHVCITAHFHFSEDCNVSDTHLTSVVFILEYI